MHAHARMPRSCSMIHAIWVIARTPVKHFGRDAGTNDVIILQPVVATTQPVGASGVAPPVAAPVTAAAVGQPVEHAAVSVGQPLAGAPIAAPPVATQPLAAVPVAAPVPAPAQTVVHEKMVESTAN